MRVGADISCSSHDFDLSVALDYPQLVQFERRALERSSSARQDRRNLVDVVGRAVFRYEVVEE